MFTLYQIPFRADVKSYPRYIIRHFEVARETGSRWLSKYIVGLFWGTYFQHGGKFVPQLTVPQCTISIRSPAQPQSGEWMAMAQNWNESFTWRDHTHRTSYRSGWPGGFGALILILTSEYLLPSFPVIAPTHLLPLLSRVTPTSIVMLIDNINQ